MASANQRTGRAWVYIDGTLYETAKGAKLTNFMGVKRNPVEGADIYGYTEETAAPTITCELIHGGSLSLTTLGQVTNSTITFQCDTGVNFILRNAWVMETGDMDSSKGTIAVTFQGKSCEEQTS